MNYCPTCEKYSSEEGENVEHEAVYRNLLRDYEKLKTEFDDVSADLNALKTVLNTMKGELK